ncbi:potassium channel family protein [Allobacillus sp. GCM10007491]|uniref:NAD-binding protein n=1 Tax=Allobacillus saliphilus TaxID=2912308 RepID=A0A941CW25_9BACI|nr:potassium channel family protein [Allobacillus saliphilus]MBR7553606.1 NAD-binding protein [Allobacillus saliphilus]
MFQQLLRTYFQLPTLFRLVITVLSFLLLFGTVIFLVEPEQFNTIFEGIWWAFITGTTIGYGDYAPVTMLGRLLTMIMILLGGGLVAYYMVAVSNETQKKEREFHQGKVAYQGKGHIIIVGWNERTRRLIYLFKENNQKPPAIVLVDRTCRSNPLPLTFVHFIKGDPTIDETWEQANIDEAEKIIITADQSLKEVEADYRSTLLTITARGIHTDIPIFTEVLTEQQKNNVLRAGATEVICTNETTSLLIYQEMLGAGHARTFDYLASVLSTKKLHLQAISKKWEDHTILELTHQLQKEGKLLLGLVREEERIINPDPNEKIQAGDQGIYMD